MKWPYKKLSEVCEIVSGGTPKTNEERYWGNDYFWATPKDLSGLNDSEISSSARKISKLGLENSSARIIPKNSVLFSSRAPIGLVAINTVPMATNQGFKNLIPNKDLLNERYLYHWLVCNRMMIESMGVGATFKEVSKAIVAAIKIPLPPLAEQQRIAEQLDTADRILRLREQAIAKLDQLAQSAFFREFINNEEIAVVKLGDVCKTTSGGTPNRSRKDYYDGSICWVKSGELKDPLVMNTEERISLLGLENSSAKLMPKGTVMLAMYGATVGAVSILGVEAATNQAICCITVDKEKVTPEYLACFLRHHKHKIIGRAVGGAQPNINQNIVRSIELPLPSMDQQIRFTNFLNHIEQTRKRFLTSYQCVNRLLSSLQCQSFALN